MPPQYPSAAVVLFGSRANGNANKDSDIDIGVVFNGIKGDWLQTSTRLWNITYDISWDIEPRLLDIAQDKSGFAQHVLKTGQVIYQA